jgi:hypothetical protein
MTESAAKLIRNRSRAVIAVGVTAILWIFSVRNFLRFLPGGHIRSHWNGLLGGYAWTGYAFIFVLIVAGMIHAWNMRGKERLWLACLVLDLLLAETEYVFAGALLVLVQYVVVTTTTAMLIIAVLILHDRWPSSDDSL